ncbi:MAG: FAD-dependent oxidoreductase, partial [Gallionellaceae bacterium]|nr:FAD-dependent oxidoreductase [Gallionellaceae bacterium]
MSQIIEVKVPGLGNFKNVPVIEVLVKPGDMVAVEQSLITLETDKASMDVPSPFLGEIKELKVKVGDRVSEDSVILLLETAAQVSPGSPIAKGAEATGAPAASRLPVHEAHVPMNMIEADLHAEVVVLGGGPGGYTAAFRAADLGKQVVLIERQPALGGVCLNVGCIPSKALLHVAKVITEAEEAAQHGIRFAKPEIDLAKIRTWKEGVVGKLTGGLAALAKQRKVQIVHGTAKFMTPNSLAVQTEEDERIITFDNAIIAAGSSVARIPGFPYDDPRLMDSTGALKLQDVPKRMLIIGGGIIGLEMATVYDALGSKISVV